MNETNKDTVEQANGHTLEQLKQAAEGKVEVVKKEDGKDEVKN